MIKYKRYRGESTLLIQIVKTKLLDIAYTLFTLKHTKRDICVYFSSTCHKSEQSFSKLISFDENSLAFDLCGICKLFSLNEVCVICLNQNKLLVMPETFLHTILYCMNRLYHTKQHGQIFSRKKKLINKRKSALHQFYYEL